VISTSPVPPEEAPHGDSTFEEIALRVRDEPCVLFLGAAIHAPPPEGSAFVYPPEHRPPLGRALSEFLAQDRGCDPSWRDHELGDLQRTAHVLPDQTRAQKAD
jgi:hypothetical protein